MTNHETEFTATLAERTIVVSWPDNERGGAVLPPDNWQERAWEERTLHEIDEGSVSGCSVLRWRDDPRTDAELLAVSLALVTGKPAAVSVPPPAPRADALAAAFREAAEALGRMDYDSDSSDYGYDTYRDAWNGGVMDGADLLRRLADEAQQPDDEALRAKVDEATATLRRIRSTIRTLKDQGATGRAYYQAITDDLAGPRPDRYEAGDEQPSAGPCVAGEQQNETPEAEAPVVAYRSRDSRSLYCTAHAGELFGLSYEPVTAEDLPDGGICTYPDCGRDVLAGPRP